LINAFAVKGKKTRPTVDPCGLFISFRGKGLPGINAMDRDVMSDPKKPEEDWSPTCKERLGERNLLAK
jgi:hypothetical protein